MARTHSNEPTGNAPLALPLLSEISIILDNMHEMRAIGINSPTLHASQAQISIQRVSNSLR